MKLSVSWICGTDDEFQNQLRMLAVLISNQIFWLCLTYVRESVMSQALKLFAVSYLRMALQYSGVINKLGSRVRGELG